jgi:energy-coupling factor transporter ATP-binding protein EcfA2
MLNGDLSADDLDELVWICKSAHGMKPNDGRVVPKAVPLGEAHIPTGPGGSSAVSLVRLGALRGVNRLKGDPPLEFGPAPGLTIIFGDNGTGKSGYARVIKKACRARGNAQTVRPNVFDPTDKGPAQAKLVCMVGVVQTPFQWRDGVPSDPRLSNIFVFDSVSAKFHVSNDGPATFIPRGLDLLPKLARACDEIRGRLNSQIATDNIAISRAADGWKYQPTTQVGKLIDGLSGLTKLESVDSLAQFDKDDGERLVELNAALKSDPKEQSSKTTAAAVRIREFNSQVAEVLRGVNSVKASSIKAAIGGATAAAIAAKAAANPFGVGYLPGTGGAVWRKLWDVARTYVATAYPGTAFPSEVAPAKCPLCQQDLDSAGITRLKLFDEYVKGETRARSEKANSLLVELSNDIAKLPSLITAFARISADLAPTPRRKVEAFAKAADDRVNYLRNCLTTVSWSAPPEFTESPATMLETAATTYDKRAMTELAADDPTKREAIIAERNELADREWLARNKQAAIDQISRYQTISTLKKCLGDTVTNTITNRSGELHDLFVSKEFCERFECEIQALGLNTLNVKLEVVGANKAERKFGIRLVNAIGGAPLAEVASEGEQRCIALAAFLAELSLSSHKSALVFDDPVSSLDHGRRASVAKRLCEEAVVRQVIIFTHDVVFLEELMDGCKDLGITPSYSHISWKGQVPGFSERGLPWDWQGYKERIAHLEAEQKRIQANWSPVPNPENVAAIGHAYSQLRATLEKIVQDVVLAGVVARYRSWIKVEQLEKVIGFSDAECKEIQRLDKKASDNVTAHDRPGGKQQQIPTPQELKMDIDAMKAIIEQANVRRAKPQPNAATSAKVSSQN